MWLTATLRVAILLLSLINLNFATPRYNYIVCQEKSTQVCYLWRITEKYGTVDVNMPSWDLHGLTCFITDMTAYATHQYSSIMIRHLGQDAERVACRSFQVVDGASIIGKPLDIKNVERVRRTTSYSPYGRFRGQTQSQYLAVDGGTGHDEGKAEAHSAADSSRATVTGNSGMGQAQSQSMFDPTCEDCLRHPDIGAESLKRGPGETSGQRGYEPSNTGATSPNGTPAAIRPPYVANQNENDGKGLDGSGSQVPDGQYGPGGQVTQGSPGGTQSSEKYGPTDSGGQYRPGGSIGQYGPQNSGGQYGPGNRGRGYPGSTGPRANGAQGSRGPGGHDSIGQYRPGVGPY